MFARTFKSISIVHHSLLQSVDVWLLLYDGIVNPQGRLWHVQDIFLCEMGHYLQQSTSCPRSQLGLVMKQLGTINVGNATICSYVWERHARLFLRLEKSVDKCPSCWVCGMRVRCNVIHVERCQVFIISEGVEEVLSTAKGCTHTM